MYNRYIPQSDGSYRRNRMQDNPPPASPQPRQNNSPEQPKYTPPVRQDGNVGGFLKNLLPREFDTGDLLIVLLLLLMTENREEDRNTALLTLALYFFM